jgi:hypothetical protein
MNHSSLELVGGEVPEQCLEPAKGKLSQIYIILAGYSCMVYGCYLWLSLCRNNFQKCVYPPQ